MRFKFKNILSGGKPFIKRLSFYLKKGSIKIHFIVEDDKDDDKSGGHTHPWDFTTFILFGGYKERLIDNKTFSFSQKDYRMFSVNKKLHHQRHLVSLYRVFGYKIPCITIGYYTEKKQVCSLTKSALKAVGYNH